MDYSKLLFAAEVRKLAVQLWQSQRAEVIREYGRADRKDLEDALNAWDDEFPLSGFVATAYSEITEVAEQVDIIQEKQQVPGQSFWVDLNQPVNAGGTATPLE